MNYGEKKNGDEIKNRLISFLSTGNLQKIHVFFISLMLFNPIVATSDEKEILQNWLVLNVGNDNGFILMKTFGF